MNYSVSAVMLEDVYETYAVKTVSLENTNNRWISVCIILSDLALQILEDNVTVVGNVSTKKCPWYAMRSPPRLNIPVDYSKAFVISVQETKVMDLVWITPDSYMQPECKARLSDFCQGKYDMQKMAYTCLLPSLVFFIPWIKPCVFLFYFGQAMNAMCVPVWCGFKRWKYTISELFPWIRQYVFS